VTPRERYLLRHLEKANGVALEQMALPSVEDVNTTRLARFDDQITQALEARSRIEGFREIIAHYVQEYDVPEVDVAAALAVVAQGDEPLLLEAEPEPVRPPRDRDPRPAAGFATYRIDVGRRHRVEPRQIVGALANEGGLSRRDFGAITIRSGTGSRTPGLAAGRSSCARTRAGLAARTPGPGRRSPGTRTASRPVDPPPDGPGHTDAEQNGSGWDLYKGRHAPSPGRRALARPRPRSRRLQRRVR
jgi:hypothetical protein